jgi:hypothetical protein
MDGYRSIQERERERNQSSPSTPADGRHGRREPHRRRSRFLLFRPPISLRLVPNEGEAQRDLTWGGQEDSSVVLGSERRRAASCESWRYWVSNGEQEEEKYGTYGYFTSRRKATKGSSMTEKRLPSSTIAAALAPTRRDLKST